MQKAPINLKNIKAYLQGKIRYKLHYSFFKFLIPLHIREQIEFRIDHMKPECYWGGQCQLCGCETTALQMANKSCDEPCYPPMMNRYRWKRFFKFREEVMIGIYLWKYSPITKAITRWDIIGQRSTIITLNHV